MSNRIVVVGSANQDLISNSDILPAIGETVMGKDFSTACGGKGGNQAVAAALLQMTPVTMICRVGDDLFGRSLLENFRKLIFLTDDSNLQEVNFHDNCDSYSTFNYCSIIALCYCIV